MRAVTIGRSPHQPPPPTAPSPCSGAGTQACPGQSARVGRPLQEMCNVCGHDSVVVLAGPSEDSPVLPGPQLVWGLSKVRRGNTLHTGGHSAEIAIAGS